MAGINGIECKKFHAYLSSGETVSINAKCRKDAVLVAKKSGYTVFKITRDGSNVVGRYLRLSRVRF